MTAVHVVVPDATHDPARPSGGNEYDRHLCRELRSLGWSVHEHAVPGFWERRPDTASLAALQHRLQQIPDEAVVMVDGLIASSAPEVLVPQARAQSLDYGIFKAQVEPIFLEKRAGHARCYVCHSERSNNADGYTGRIAMRQAQAAKPNGSQPRSHRPA